MTGRDYSAEEEILDELHLPSPSFFLQLAPAGEVSQPDLVTSIQQILNLTADNLAFLLEKCTPVQFNRLRSYSHVRLILVEKC